MMVVEAADGPLEELPQRALAPQDLRQLTVTWGMLGRAHVSHQRAQRQERPVLGVEVPELLRGQLGSGRVHGRDAGAFEHRSEEHTSELQSRFDLVCRLLLEKKNKRNAY